MWHLVYAGTAGGTKDVPDTIADHPLAPSCVSGWSSRFAEVADFQRRGVVHFHALVRLEGPGLGYPPPAVAETVEQLRDAITPPPAKPLSTNSDS